MWFVFALLSAIFASVYLNTGKGGDRWSKLKSCDSHQNGCRCNHGMGDGFFNKYTKRIIRNQPEKLDFFDFVRIGNRRFLAVLL